MKTPSFAHTIGESALAGAAGIISVNISGLKCFWEGGKSRLSVASRNNIFEHLLFKMTLASHRHTQFAHEIGESGLSRVGRNNVV